MPSECERLEREVGAARRQLAATLEELRERVTPVAVVDGLFEYGRSGRTGEFLRNLAREVRENPLPLILIGVGAAWLFFAASRTMRSVVSSTGESASRKVSEIGVAATTLAYEARETAAQLAERLTPARNTAAELGNPEEAAILAAAAATSSDKPLPATHLDSSLERQSSRTN